MQALQLEPQPRLEPKPELGLVPRPEPMLALGPMLTLELMPELLPKIAFVLPVQAAVDSFDCRSA